MRLYNYINEARGISPNELPQAISKCQPFIKDISKYSQLNFLWSGRKGKPHVFYGRVRTNRKPKDTPKEIHDVLDQAFEDNFGVKARSQSIFCSIQPQKAKEYGTPYIILPIGKYKTIWSSQVDDLYIYLEQYIQNELDIGGAFQGWDDSEPEDREEVLNFLEENLPDAIRRWYTDEFYMKGIGSRLRWKQEVMLVCQEYLAISEDYREEAKRIIEEEFS